MPRTISDADYDTLEEFVLSVLQKVERGDMTSSSGRNEIMHPLTALIDNSGGNEFIPYMKLRLEQWGGDNADRT